MEDVHLEKSKAPDWGALRAWANLFFAGATLIVAIVSIWLTTQISGLEDYLRSEIAVRNSELVASETEASALDARIQQSTSRLADLRSTSDLLATKSVEAQALLSDAQNQSIILLTEQQRTQAELVTSRQRLLEVTMETEEQRMILERFYRDQVLRRAYSTFSYLEYADYFRGGKPERNKVDGPFAIREMRSFGLNVRDPNLAQHFESIRSVGPTICRSLASFSPEFPATVTRPKLEPLKGERTDRGLIRTTNKEVEAWNARVALWSANWDAVARYNDSIREAKSLSERFIVQSIRRCSCIALKGASQCEALPKAPDVEAIILPRPDVQAD